MAKGAKKGNTIAADSYKARPHTHHVDGDKNRELTVTRTYRMGHSNSKHAEYRTIEQAKRVNPDSTVRLIRYVSITPKSTKQLHPTFKSAEKEANFNNAKFVKEHVPWNKGKHYTLG